MESKDVLSNMLSRQIDINEQLQLENDEMNQNLKRLLNLLTQKDKQLEDMKTRVATVEVTEQEFQNEIEQKIQQIAELQEQQKNLELELGQHNEVRQKMECELKKIINAFEGMQNINRQQQEEITNIKERNSYLEDEQLNMQVQLEQNSKQIKLLGSSNEDYEKQTDLLMKQTNELKQIQIKLLYSLDAIQKEKDELTSQFDEKLAQFKTVFQNTSESTKDLTQQVNSLTQENQQYQKQVILSFIQIQQLTVSVNDSSKFEQERNKIVELYQDLQEEHNILIQKHKMVEQQLSILSQDQEQSIKKMKYLVEQVEQLEETNESQMKQNNELKQQIKKLQFQQDQLLKDKEVIYDQFEQIQKNSLNEHEGSREKYTKLDRMYKELHCQYDELLNRVRIILIQYKIQNQQNEEQSAQFQLNIKEINELRQTIRILQESDRKNAYNSETLGKEKFLISQKLEESFLIIKELKDQYNLLSEKLSKTESYNKQLLLDGEQQIKTIKAYEGKIEEHEVHIELLQVQINHRAAQQAELERQSTVKQSNKKPVSANKENNPEVVRLRKQNTELTKEAISLNEEILELKDTINKLNEQSAQSAKIKQGLEQRVQSLIKVIEEFQSKQLQKQSESVSKEQFQHQMEQIKKNFYIQIQQLTRENEELKKIIQNQTNQTFNSNEEVASLQDTVADLNREKVNLIRELNQEHEGKLKIEKESQQLKQQIEQYQLEIDGYQNQLDLYVNVLKQMDEKLKKQ